MECRLFGGVTPPTAGNKNSAAALVIDLTNLKPNNMITQVQHSIEDRSDMRPLKKVSEDASAEASPPNPDVPE